MGSPFTDEEKRFLLAEMIKVSKVDVHALVEFVKANRVEQKWYSIQVPTGRNLEQCFQAAESMFGAPISPPSLLRETPSTQQMPSSSSTTALAPHPSLPTVPQPPEAFPTDSSLPPISAVTPGVAVPPNRSSTPQHVPIQPRPPTTINGVPNLASSLSAEPPAKRRRGRPPRPKTLHNRSGAGGTKSLPPLAPLPPSSTASQHLSTPTPIAPLAESSTQRTLSPAYSVSAGANFEGLSAPRGQKRGPPVKDDEQQHSTSEAAASALGAQSMSSTPRPDSTPGPQREWPLQPDEDRSNRLQTLARQATTPPPPSTTQSQQGASPLSAAKATPVRT
ncbi:hypothetical protein SAPIO_CDS2937 [Scedosporium apiospermum]|uniref:Uncharacterized protein n=1 Tax=Pseudallescheria apiosperma TaxID=563466 RepID=A0A084GBV9_PSEDA|nr:uncharacterized protein SAPIO_CDS2937 [Scedosporium apiospermum]KEZ44821.1 hypothetical protein SAPIO_CDS2937 [Scedosporium apiospermum]